MKKIFTPCLLSIFLLSLTASPGLCQTAKEVLAKMIEAQGGKKVFENTKDITMSGTFDLIQQGLSGSVTVHKKEPDKRRMDFEVMGMVVTQAYDGKTAWATNPQTGSTEEMPEQQAAEMKRDAMPLVSILYPEKYGLSFALKEKEKIEDKDYFVLEMTFPDGFKATLYIDPETYLIYKTKAKAMGQMGVEVESEQFASDYKKVNGMMMAHSITIFNDGEEYLTITITEVNFNTGLEDSLFKMSE
jgi:outer membrane lipoprotein-sorting protein